MYDELADYYHLIFKDWDRSMQYQGEVIEKLLPSMKPRTPVLDCACGIGTQAIALARLGYDVHACDLSAAAVDRAIREAEHRGVAIAAWQDDMRTLTMAPAAYFQAVVCFDNALPHLDGDEEIAQALKAMRECMVPNGTLLISLRDYGPLMSGRPHIYGPIFHGDAETRRIVHQVWSWRDRRRYAVTLFLTISTPDGQCEIRQFDGGAYRAIMPEEVASLAQAVGFHDVAVLTPSDTGYYQPIISACA